MTKNTYAKTALPAECQQILSALGARIRMARKSRNMTLQELAARMLVSVKTVQRLEQGEAGVSLGVLLSALLCMGLEQNMEALAALETDTVGMVHLHQNLQAQQRVRKSPRESADFDF